MIELTQDKEKIWVNPQQILSLRVDAVSEQTLVEFEKRTLLVEESVEDILNQIWPKAASPERLPYSLQQEQDAKT